MGTFSVVFKEEKASRQISKAPERFRHQVQRSEKTQIFTTQMYLLDNTLIFKAKH